MQQESTFNSSALTSSAGSVGSEAPVPSEFEHEFTEMDGLLVEFLAAVRLDMFHSLDQMMALIEQRSEVFQRQSARHLELQTLDLHLQNRKLRDELANSQAGQDGCNDVIAKETMDMAPKHSSEIFPKSMASQRAASSAPAISPGTTHALQHPVYLKDNLSVPTEQEDTGFRQIVSRESPNGSKASPPFKEPDPPAVMHTKSKGKDRDPYKDALRRSLADRRRSGLLPRRHRQSIGSSSSGSRKDKEQQSLSREVTYESDGTPVLPDLEMSKKVSHATKSTSEMVVMSHRLSTAGTPGSTRAATKIFGVHVSSQMGSQFQPELESNESSKGYRPTLVGQAVFADAQAMKERVRAAVTKPEYNVSDYYWDSGICQRIARHPLFEYTTLFVIGSNALWIAVEADENVEDFILDAHPVFIVADNVFCIFFVLEWLVRFMSFREKRFVTRDFWFMFDTVLLFIMIMETWVMTLIVAIYGAGLSSRMGKSSVLKLIRLTRLTRMARMVKILRRVPELIILIKGIVVAARSVFFTLTLLFLLIYVFAIVLRQVTHDTEIGARYYASVPQAMRSLLLDAVLPDQAPAVRANADASIFLGLFILVFILLSSLTVMNMLVGILCEVVSVVSAVEKEQLAVNFVKQRLETLLASSLSSNDGSKNITKVEFERLLTNGETAKIIQDLGVDLIGLVDFVDIIFEDDVELSFGDFMQLVLQLRGSNNCTVKDMVDLRKFFITELNILHSELNMLGETLGRMPEDMRIDSSDRLHRRSQKTLSSGSETPPKAKERLAVSVVPPESEIIQRLHRRNICRV